MDKMDVVINTGTSIIQAFYEKKGSTLKDEYRQATAVAFMDPRDMDKLGIKERDKIEVKTDWGEVVLFADKSHDAPHESMIFIPKGPWANIIINPETYCCNVPTYKGIEATIKKTQKPVLLTTQLMAQRFNKYENRDPECLSDKPYFIRKEDE